MIRRLSALLFLLLAWTSVQASTWYVRHDGGTRYSTNNTAGQCDGLGDAAYPGSGTNQHCAFNDIRLLWQDGSYAFPTSSFPSAGWVGQGGDTYIIRGSVAAGSAPYRVGWSSEDGNGADPALIAAGDPAPYRGWRGDPYSGPPSPPSGTAQQHTRILGENWASCHSRGARTPVIAGHSVGSAFNVSTSYVDVQCFDISDQSECVVSCNGQDAGKTGIGLANSADHLTLTDIRVHGLVNFGILGPSGDVSVFSYITLVGNGGGGWSADANDLKTGLGSLSVTNYEISWNGCAEAYPITPDTYPYKNCRDQSHGGYGDGWGTSSTDIAPNGTVGQAYSWPWAVQSTGFSLTSGALPPGLSIDTNGNITGTPTQNGLYVAAFNTNNGNRQIQIAVGSYPQGWQVTFDKGLVTYNTQDGLDALHLRGLGSSVSVTHTLTYGNMGQQLKIGGQAARIDNNLIVGTCTAMSFPITGTISGFNTNLSDFCRAGAQTVLASVGYNSTTYIRHNTILTNALILTGFECDGLSGPCDGSALADVRDNILVGTLSQDHGYSSAIYNLAVDTSYPDQTSCAAAPHHHWSTASDGALGCVNEVLSNTGSYNQGNVMFNVKEACTDNNGSNNTCAAPGLGSYVTPNFGYGDMTLASSSSVGKGAGVAISTMQTDYALKSFASPPSAGALELASTMVVYTGDDGSTVSVPIVAVPGAPASLLVLTGLFSGHAQ